jgi:hypothetical protein
MVGAAVGYQSRAFVTFGAPIPVSDVNAESRRDVLLLARRTLDKARPRKIPTAPVPLAAAFLPSCLSTNRLTGGRRSSILEAVVLVHRLSAVLLCLGLIAGNAAVCAGWPPTPEARMACCADGDCPMHKGESDESISQRVLTQAQADACCAASEREQPDTSSPTTVVSIAAPILGTGIVLPAPIPARILSDGWRTEAPRLIPPVPRHVLLSVFLV